MTYKMQFYNFKTKQFYLGEHEYNTIQELQEDLNDSKLPSRDIAFSKVVEMNEPEPKTPDTVEKDDKEAVYDLTDDGKGKKYDSNKSMVGTLCRVFPRALLGIGQCIEFGTHKYPKPDNWKLVDGAFTRYQDSMMRHYLKFLAGQEKDGETNLLHLKHMAWNALAILELYLMEHDEKDLFI